MILGPVGLLAGLLLGGRNKEITFVAKFKNGKKIFASTDSKTFTKLQAVIFNQTSKLESPYMSITKKTPIEQLESDRYVFVAKDVVRKDGPWDECMVKISADKIELYQFGTLFKVYT